MDHGGVADVDVGVVVRDVCGVGDRSREVPCVAERRAPERRLEPPEEHAPVVEAAGVDLGGGQGCGTAGIPARYGPHAIPTGPAAGPVVATHRYVRSARWRRTEHARFGQPGADSVGPARRTTSAPTMDRQVAWVLRLLRRTTTPLQRDCVLAVSRGGWYTLDNVVPACRSCNASKCNDESGWLRRRRFDEAVFLLRHLEIRTSLAPIGP